MDSTYQEWPGFLELAGWHGGFVKHPVTVVGETPKRYRVKLHANVKLPHQRYGKAGDVVLVPKYAILRDETETHTQDSGSNG